MCENERDINASVRQRFPHVIKVATKSHSSVDTRLLKVIFCTNSHRNVDTDLTYSNSQ